MYEPWYKSGPETEYGQAVRQMYFFAGAAGGIVGGGGSMLLFAWLGSTALGVACCVAEAGVFALVSRMAWNRMFD